jgi:hypothetical protein
LQGPAPAPDRAPAVSVAPLPASQPPAARGPAHSLAPLLSIGIALLFLIERVHATRTRATAQPRA